MSRQQFDEPSQSDLEKVKNTEDRLIASSNKGHLLQHSVVISHGTEFDESSFGFNFDEPETTPIRLSAPYGEVGHDHVFEGADESSLDELAACLEPISSLIANLYSQEIGDNQDHTYSLHGRDRLLVRWIVILYKLVISGQLPHIRANVTVLQKTSEGLRKEKFSKCWNSSPILGNYDPWDPLLGSVSPDEWVSEAENWCNHEGDDFPRAFMGSLQSELFQASRALIEKFEESILLTGELPSSLEFRKPRKVASRAQMKIADEFALREYLYGNGSKIADIKLTKEAIARAFGWSESRVHRILSKVLSEQSWKAFKKATSAAADKLKGVKNSRTEVYERVQKNDEVKRDARLDCKEFLKDFDDQLENGDWQSLLVTIAKLKAAVDTVIDS